MFFLCHQYTRKYPLKEKIKKKKIRYFNYFAIQNEDFYLMQKRNNNDIWKNLFELSNRR